MATVGLILMVAAFILFVLGALGIPGVPQRYNLVSAGLACWALTVLIGGMLQMR
jgi:hypothetical protein